MKNMEKVLFSNRYELPGFSEEELEETEREVGNHMPSAEEFVRMMEEERTYVPIAEKVKNADKVTAFAQKLSETYEIDMDIIQKEDGVEILIYGMGAKVSGSLKEYVIQLMTVCDHFFVWTGKKYDAEYVLDLEYVTHETYLAGKKMNMY